MKNKCVHLAMAACMAVSLLASTASASFSGAIYTSLSDGATVNANHYDLREDVYLNGGPQNETGSGLPDGIYLFEVTDPSTSDLLSTDPASYRQVWVFNGRIYGVPAVPEFGESAANMHAVGSYNATTQSIPVQLFPYDYTTNAGGVYKVTLYSVDGGATPNGLYIDSPTGNKKSDNFKVKDDGGVGAIDVIIFGRKYYDANANGVYDGGEEWTSADGRPQVTININSSQGAVQAFTDDDGLWFHIFNVPLGETLDFTACEVVPEGYTQTGPLDGDTVTNAEASAEAFEGCWSGTVTYQLGLNNLNFGNVDTVTLGGVKFYDANANGSMDEGEVTIPGFKIILEITYPDDTTDTVELLTDAGGAWSYEVPIGSDVTACEVMPIGSWVQTAPALGCHSLEDVSEDTSDLDFGNVCLGPGGGKTLGFWSNKNGQAQMNDGGTMAPELALLVGLNLRKANGDAFDPANYSAFRNWLLSATATNMAYMLSAQLAAMELNVEAGWVSDGAIVWNSCTGFTTIGAVTDAANAALGADGLTLADDPNRAEQECLKNVLDDANNNLNFVQAQPCDVEYPPEE